MCYVVEELSVCTFLKCTSSLKVSLLKLSFEIANVKEAPIEAGPYSLCLVSAPDIRRDTAACYRAK
jgi:hypothetical protein